MRKFFRRLLRRNHKPEAAVAIYVHGSIYRRSGTNICVTTPDNNTQIVGNSHIAPNGVSITRIAYCLALADGLAPFPPLSRNGR